MSIGDKISSFRDGSYSWLKLFFLFVATIGVIVGIAWMGLSIYANFQEYNFFEIKNDVSVKKAQYEFKIITTGEVLLTKDFDSVASGNRDKYILHGYYKIIQDKWKYIDADLSLDENYFGTIEFQLRH